MASTTRLRDQSAISVHSEPLLGRPPRGQAFDPDLREMILLPDAKLFQADQLKHGEKGDHDFGATGRVRKAFLEANRNAVMDHAKQKIDLVGNRKVLLENFAQVFAAACRFPAV